MVQLHNNILVSLVYLYKTYGLHLPGNLGYNEQSLTVNLSHNQAKILSVPKPYPPCGQVPYFLKSVNQ